MDEPRLTRLENGNVMMSVKILIYRESFKKRIYTPETEKVSNIGSALKRNILLAVEWTHALETGAFKGVKELAECYGLDPSYVRRVMALSLLSPSIMQALFNNEIEVPSLNALQKGFPLEWDEQEKFLAGK